LPLALPFAFGRVQAREPLGQRLGPGFPFADLGFEPVDVLLGVR
jgi:hypothetical protein